MTSLIINPASSAIIPTITATVSPSTAVVVGTPITVSWFSTNAAVVRITGLISSSLIQGQANINAPLVPGTYFIILEATSSTNNITSTVISLAVSSTAAIIPNIVITALPGGTVAPGASVKFNWTVTNADSATIVSAALGINSTQLVGSATATAPTLSGNIYSLLVTATSSTGNVSTKSISITIDSVPSVTGSFSPYNVNPGQATTLSWQAVNTTSLLVSGLGINSIALSSLGTSILAPTTLGIQSVNWTAKNDAGTSVTGVFKLNVIAATPVIPVITGSFVKSSITTAETASFTWAVTNATNVLVSGLINSTLNGSTQTILAQPTAGTYTITITAKSSTGDTASASYTLIVTNVVPVTPTFNGEFSPASVTPGQSSVLTWSGTNLASLKLFNTDLAVDKTYTNQAQGTLTVTAPNIISTQLVAYTATSSTKTVITGTIPLAIQRAIVIPSVTGSFSVAEPAPNQTTVLTFVPINAVSVTLTNEQLSISDVYAVTSGTSYTRPISAPIEPGVYPVMIVATSSSGDNRSVTASIEVKDIIPTLTSQFDTTGPTFAGATRTLSWTATNALTVTLYSADLGLDLTFGSLTGSYSVTAPATVQTYDVIVIATSATEATAVVVASFTVIAQPVKPEVTGSFSPSSVNPKQTTTLTWSTTNAITMSITGDVTSSLLNGSQTVVAPTSTGKRTTGYTATSTTGDVTSGVWVYEVVAVTPVIPAVTGSFNPATITQGQSSTFSWSSTDALLLQLTGAVSSTTVSGSQTVTPTASGTQSVNYLATSVTGDTRNGSFNLTVNAAEPATVTGSFSPTIITLGESTTFTWSSTNTTNLSISGLTSSNLLTGSRTITPATVGTQTINYTATNAAGNQVSGSFTVQVNAAVVPITPTVTGSFSPASVTAGQSSTFSWSSTNATNLLLSGAVNSTATSGSELVSTSSAGTQTVNYTVVSSTNNTASGKFDLTITAVVPITPTVTGTFSPLSCTLGQSCTFTWTSTDATSLTLSGAVSNTSTSGSVSIDTSTSGTKTVYYTAASSTGTVATGKFDVVVAAAVPITPTVTGSFSPATIALGQSTTLTWSSTNATTMALSGAVTSSQLNGSSSITPSSTGTQTVNYTATSSTGTKTTGTFTVQVNAVTPIYPTVNVITRWSASYDVSAGQQNTLTWLIDNAVSAKLSGQVTSTAVSGTATITVPTTAGIYSAYIDATSSTGHKLQAGIDGVLPRHVDFRVVAAAALKGSITSPTTLSAKQQRQIVITGDAAAGTQNYTVSLSTGTADTTGATLTGTISSGSLTICLKGTNSAGTATLTLSKTGYTNYSGSVAYAANTKYSPYLLTAGFPQESKYTSAKLTTATWIANNLYKGIATAYTTALGTRYGLGRAPDYGGLVFWTDRCIATYAGNYSGSAFLSAFFAEAGGSDLTNSKTPSKTYNPGTGYGDFYDRPN